MSKKMGFSSFHQFLQESHKYQLGFLPTEQSHTETWDLSQWAQNDLPKAIKKLQQLDLHVLSVLQDKLIEAHELSEKIKEVFGSGGRVFLCGCGATGRLSLLIEAIWNRCHPQKKGQVLSFMAGGDIALVQSVEGFEDHPSYGERQLKELGFSANDLLISSTEGGETPFVIGVTQTATEISKHPSYFLFCNPQDILIQKIERSRQIINHKKVIPVELFVGSMGVAGSTRMQASTVLQAFISMALFLNSKEERALQLRQFTDYFASLDTHFLQEFIETESNIYKKGERLTYSVSDTLALGTFTDTTERAPTFSMKPFDHPENMSLPLSMSYICIESAEGASEAWTQLLSRAPRALGWADVSPRVSVEFLKGFDFSPRATKKREQLSPSPHFFKMTVQENTLFWKLGVAKKSISHPEFHSLWQQLLLKSLLNIHSTLVMGRLGRYQNNLMTWVDPSNGKLIDRTARYILYLLEKEERSVTYEKVVQKIFETSMAKDQSVVLEIYQQIKKENQ